MKNISVRRHVPLALGIISLCCFVMRVEAEVQGEQQAWQQVIDAQQRQLEVQQEQLDAQRQLLEQIQSQTKSMVENASKEVERLGNIVKQQQQQLESLQLQTNQSPTIAADTQPQAGQAKPAADDMKMTPPAREEQVVVSGSGAPAKLVVSGFVNRAINIVDDGRDTDAYFVDNDNAESRISFVGTVKPNDDLTIGSRIELSIAPNKAGNVNQNNEDENNIFDQRWTEVSLDSERYGKLSLGKGATASYGTATLDLSGTGVIAYATIADTAGGMLFREKDGGELTNIRILDAFNTWDGLNRRSRVRYDSPRFHGFSLAASAVSDSRYDAAVRWGGQGNGFKAMGGAAVADPNERDAGLQYDGSFSILHEDTGLNLTLSAGKLERDNQSDPYNLYGKLGWQEQFFSFGQTAFAVDYTRSVNLPTADDEGYSYGIGVVQQFDAYGTEIFGLYRLHSLDRDVEAEVDDIGVVSIGTRVKF